jgi:hypothetical protein
MGSEDDWTDEDIRRLEESAKGGHGSAPNPQSRLLLSAFRQGCRYERRIASILSAEVSAKTWRHFETTLRVLGNRAGMSKEEADVLVTDFEKYCDRQWTDGYSEGYDVGAASTE